VGGCERPFSLTQNFRVGDEGELHNPEFTMLEWARAYEPLDTIEDDAERMIRRAFDALQSIEQGVGQGDERGGRLLRYGDHTLDLDQRFHRLGVREALKEKLGVTLADDFSLASMLDGARRAGLDLPASVQGDAHDAFSYLLLLLSPRLGLDAPVFLREWPAFMTSSASVSAENPSKAERSELFMAGIEIADGFPSLRDPTLQEQLFARELGRRRALGGEEVALDERYIEALRQGLPPGSGMALGVDRLVMVLCGAASIREVIPFAWDEL
jgi:elongation factor P--(R)-beta-lysine ligase